MHLIRHNQLIDEQELEEVAKGRLFASNRTGCHSRQELIYIVPEILATRCDQPPFSEKLRQLA